jgi:hypothetical protein
MSQPQKYRKKPVVIEAMQWRIPFGSHPSHDQALGAGWDRAKEIAQWCGGKRIRDDKTGQQLKTYYWSIEIPTLEGVMRASLGDFIIKGVNGEFYPCKPDIFAKTYEAVEAGHE